MRVLQERSPNKGQAWDNYWGGTDQQASGSDSLAMKASRSNMGAGVLLKDRVWVRVCFGSRPQTDAIGRTKRKGRWKWWWWLRGAGSG